MKLTHIPHDSGLVYVRLKFDHGSKTDPDQEEGLSHLLEHCLFLGTENQTKEELDRKNAFLGSFNAGTSMDMMCIHASCLHTDQREVIEQFADILGYCTFPEDSFEKEKEIVKQEISRAKSDLWGSLSGMASEHLFEKNYSVLGSTASVNRIKVEGIHEAYNELHHSIAHLFIVGGSADDAKWSRDRLMKSLSGKMKTKPDRGDCEDFVLNNAWTKRKNIDVDSCIFLASWLTDKCDSLKQYVLDKMSAYFLGGDESCFLFKKIRDELGAAYSTSAFSGMMGNNSYIDIYAQTTADRLKEVRKIILDKATRKEITEDELYELKKKIKYSLFLSNQTPGQLMGRALTFIDEIGLKRVPTLYEQTGVINKITASDINSNLEDFFCLDPYISIVGKYALPKPKKEKK